MTVTKAETGTTTGNELARGVITTRLVIIDTAVTEDEVLTACVGVEVPT